MRNGPWIVIGAESFCLSTSRPSHRPCVDNQSTDRFYARDNHDYLTHDCVNQMRQGELAFPTALSVMSGLREMRRTDAVSSIGAMQTSIVFSIFPQTFTQDVRKCLRESQPTL